MAVGQNDRIGGGSGIFKCKFIPVLIFLRAGDQTGDALHPGDRPKIGGRGETVVRLVDIVRVRNHRAGRGGRPSQAAVLSLTGGDHPQVITGVPRADRIRGLRFAGDEGQGRGARAAIPLIRHLGVGRGDNRPKRIADLRFLLRQRQGKRMLRFLDKEDRERFPREPGVFDRAVFPGPFVPSPLAAVDKRGAGDRPLKDTNGIDPLHRQQRLVELLDHPPRAVIGDTRPAHLVVVGRGHPGEMSAAAVAADHLTGARIKDIIEHPAGETLPERAGDITGLNLKKGLGDFASGDFPAPRAEIVVVVVGRVFDAVPVIIGIEEQVGGVGHLPGQIPEHRGEIRFVGPIEVAEERQVAHDVRIVVADESLRLFTIAEEDVNVVGGK